MVEPCLELFRRESEKCDRVEDVLIYASSMGGTGSGLSRSLITSLDSSSKLKIVSTVVVPSPDYPGPADSLGIYNNVLRNEDFISCPDLEIWVCNEQLERICKTKLGIAEPNIHDLNKLIVS